MRVTIAPVAVRTPARARRRRRSRWTESASRPGGPAVGDGVGVEIELGPSRGCRTAASHEDQAGSDRGCARGDGSWSVPLRCGARRTCGSTGCYEPVATPTAAPHDGHGSIADGDALVTRIPRTSIREEHVDDKAATERRRGHRPRTARADWIGRARALAGAARSVVDSRARSTRRRRGADSRRASSPPRPPSDSPRSRDVPLATVINATGVIVHTNLGRAPWPRPRSTPRPPRPATISSSSSIARPVGAARASAWPRSTSSR